MRTDSARFVQGVHDGHLGVAELEIEDIDVRRDPFRGDRLGDHHIAGLQVPADDHLGRRFAVRRRDFGECGIFQQIALGQRTPGLGVDAVRLAESSQFTLLQVRVQFDLVDRRNRAAEIDELLQVVLLEVGDANRFRFAGSVDLLESPPGVGVQIVVRLGPVDQIEIHVIQPQLVQALVEGGQSLLVSLFRVPQLGGDEQLGPVDAGLCEELGDGLAHPGFISVDRRGVDAPVSGVQRAEHRCGGLVVRHLPHAQSELGHADAVVEGDVGDVDGH